jgi:intracellular multiplication protein IcmP
MPPAAPQGSPQQQGDNSLAALWITLFFFALLGAIWYLFHPQIVWFILRIKYYEAVFLSIFTSGTLPLVQALKQINFSGVGVENLITLSNAVGQYMRYLVIVVLVLLATVLYFAHPTLKFKRAHNMKTLYEQEKFNWPQIMPASTINLVKEPIDKGPWAMSLTPLQLAKKYRLLVEEREKKAGIGAAREKINVSIARAEAYQVFATQLGAYFYSVDKLTMHTKALFAIFAARANRNEATAKRLLDQLAFSSVTGRLDFSGVNDVANKYKDTPPIKQLLERHAYVLTMMASMLEAARQDGVVASADFLWLKLVDRPLWYVLNGLGRQTAFPEIAGPFAHWLAEKKIGRKIHVPMVEEAVKALEEALKDVLYVPDREEGRQ